MAKIKTVKMAKDQDEDNIDGKDYEEITGKVYRSEDFNKLREHREKNPNKKFYAYVSSSVPTVKLQKSSNGVVFESSDSGKNKKRSKERRKIIKEERMKSGETNEDLKNWLYGMIALTIGGLIMAIAFWYGDNLTMFLVGLTASFWGFLLTLVIRGKYVRNESFSNPFEDMTPKERKSFWLWAVTLVTIVTLFILEYNDEAKDPSPLTALFMCLILWFRMAISINDTLKEDSEYKDALSDEEYNRRMRKGDIFNRFNFTSQSIIAMLIFPLILYMLLGIDLYGIIYERIGKDYSSIDTWTQMFVSCCILVCLSGIIGIQQTKRSASYNTDYDRSELVRYAIMIVLPIIGMVLMPTIIEEKIVEANLASGVVGRNGVDYFGTVYVAIIDNPATQFSGVMILISSLSILIGKARGRSGSSNMIIGALGVAGVPMIIAVMIFFGRVDVPPVFLEIFDEGFAQLIYTISYTSIISLLLAFVGVFYDWVPSATKGLLDD